MKNTASETTKKRLTLTDIFFLVAAALLLTAIVGQDLAVYFINRDDKSETFWLNFKIVSAQSEKANELFVQRSKNADVTVWYKDETNDGELKELGKVMGGFESSGTGDYIQLTGTVSAQGKTSDGECKLYGFNRTFKKGDRLLVIFEGSDDNFSPAGYYIEITEIINMTERDPAEATNETAENT